MTSCEGRKRQAEEGRRRERKKQTHESAFLNRRSGSEAKHEWQLDSTQAWTTHVLLQLGDKGVNMDKTKWIYCTTDTNQDRNIEYCEFERPKEALPIL